MLECWTSAWWELAISLSLYVSVALSLTLSLEVANLALSLWIGAGEGIQQPLAESLVAATGSSLVSLPLLRMPLIIATG